VGTTNRIDWNRDETGGSRYMPIACTKVDLDWIEANREQLFAEAVHRFKAGEKWHIWPLDVARQKQSERVGADPWEEAIERNWRDAARDMQGRQLVTVPSVLSDVLGIPIAAHTTSVRGRVAAILRRLGFKSLDRVRVNGVREYPWLPPEQSDPLLD
jgi:predicted P-loop ATPase